MMTTFGCFGVFGEAGGDETREAHAQEIREREATT
jgi:hypothetical protein